jgi:hypothetical protein
MEQVRRVDVSVDRDDGRTGSRYAENMMRGKRRSGLLALSVGWLMLITACADQSTRPSDATTYNEASAWSFEQEAAGALLERLRQSCRSPQSPALPPQENTNDCIKSRAVAAFDAEAGELYCRHQSEPALFVQCIVNGAYATHMADKLGIDLPIEILWGDKVERTAEINGELTGRANKDVLQLLEIEESDIRRCPVGEMRNVCIGKVAVTRFVNSRLMFVF